MSANPTTTGIPWQRSPEPQEVVKAPGCPVQVT